MVTAGQSILLLEKGSCALVPLTPVAFDIDPLDTLTNCSIL